METDFVGQLVTYRLLVGYLGEKEQYGWWQSSFFTQGAGAFLTPLFPRTQMLAQCNGVTQAAALVHDERIGVGHVYHLFRLPEDLEQSIHQLLQEPAFTQSLPRLVAQRAEALENLRRLGSGTEKVDPGPQLIGPTNALRDIKFLRRAAGFYSAGFSHNTPVFPYFTDAA